MDKTKLDQKTEASFSRKRSLRPTKVSHRRLILLKIFFTPAIIFAGMSDKNEGEALGSQGDVSAAIPLKELSPVENDKKLESPVSVDFQNDDEIIKPGHKKQNNHQLIS